MNHGFSQTLPMYWYINSFVMCYRVYVTTHVKDPNLLIVKVGHNLYYSKFGSVPLCSPHVLNRVIYAISTESNSCSTLPLILLYYQSTHRTIVRQSILKWAITLVIYSPLSPKSYSSPLPPKV